MMDNFSNDAPKAADDAAFDNKVGELNAQIDLQTAAESLRGEVYQEDKVRCPGPGHSADDRSLIVHFRDEFPDSFYVYSFARLAALGLVATTVAFGSWANVEKTPLSGRDVIVLPDEDDAGRVKEKNAVEALSKVAGSIRVVHVPGLTGAEESNDLSDWLDAGGDRDRLLELVQAEAQTPTEEHAGEHWRQSSRRPMSMMSPAASMLRSHRRKQRLKMKQSSRRRSPAPARSRSLHQQSTSSPARNSLKALRLPIRLETLEKDGFVKRERGDSYQLTGTGKKAAQEAQENQTLQMLDR